jgi:hypothetical protein
MSPFRIFVEGAQTPEDTKERVGALAELWPGECIIQNEETGERLFITAGPQGKN